MSALVNEAYLQLESRLVAYLKALQALPGSPLDDRKILPGHSDVNLDNITNYICVYVERADTQPYWQAGLEICEVKIMLETSADDSALGLHNRVATALRVAFDLRNLPALKAAVNLAPGFGLSGLKAGQPPVADGFNAKDRRRQALLRFIAVCGVEGTG